jgi:hypothetical protein
MLYLLIPKQRKDSMDLTGYVFIAGITIGSLNFHILKLSYIMREKIYGEKNIKYEIE